MSLRPIKFFVIGTLFTFGVIIVLILTLVPPQAIQ